jgi:hypothetical protein
MIGGLSSATVSATSSNLCRERIGGYTSFIYGL